MSNQGENLVCGVDMEMRAQKKLMHICLRIWYCFQDWFDTVINPNSKSDQLHLNENMEDDNKKRWKNTRERI